ncbi:MAG: hypothetical protein IAF38_08495, partial [Bacteroidia bacterium]|nr:hypothetical protein [Bacteroidia bacterium]
MENNFADLPENIASKTLPLNRPKLLTVLCILSFVGAFLGIFYYGGTLCMNYLFEDSTGFLYYLASTPPFSAQPINVANHFSELIWTVVSLWACLISQFISLFGILLMFRQRKKGFFIYVFSEFIALGFLIASAVGKDDLLWSFSPVNLF